MSYNGTVYCRNCGNKGHNRRTCPDLTECYKRRAQSEVDAGENRDGHWHKEYAKRTGKWLNGEEAVELKKTRAGGTRRCKYCAKRGHNIRTCPELKQAKAEAIDLTRIFRTTALETLKRRGLGVGALVAHEKYGEKIAYMVKGVNWTGINHRSGNNNSGLIQIEVLNPGNMSHWQRSTTIPLPPVQGESAEESLQWNNYQVIGPIAAEAVSSTIPDGWLEDNSFVTAMFDGQQSPDFYENQYDY